MRIGLYGMPTAGKSYIMNKIDFMPKLYGSSLLREICPGFETASEYDRILARRRLAENLADRDTFIMDGHYAFGNQVVFTESDGLLYDVFIYLYISPDKLIDRMKVSERNCKYLKYDISEWQKREVESLREYCHVNEKDFYVLDKPPGNVFNEVLEVIDFIKAVSEGYSCAAFAKDIAKDILEKSSSDTVILMDGDKTLTIEDTSNKVFGYQTHLYDGNFYTGFQSWKQGKEFANYYFDDIKHMPVALNEKVYKEIGPDTYILTSGHERIWEFISKELNIPFYYGSEMSAETKLYITKFLQKSGKKVVAYGDGMNDYYMLKQADKGYLVTKKDSSISRSLNGRNLEGLNLV